MATRRTPTLAKSLLAAVTASRTCRSRSARRLFSAITRASENSPNVLSRSQIVDALAAYNVTSAKFLSLSFTRSFHATNPSLRSAASSQVSQFVSHSFVTSIIPYLGREFGPFCRALVKSGLMIEEVEL